MAGSGGLHAAPPVNGASTSQQPDPTLPTITLVRRTMSLYDIKALPEGTRREAATSLLQQLPWDAEVVALPRNGRVLVVRAAGAPPATEFKLREGGTCTIRPSPPPISRVPDPTARNKREKYTKKEFLDFCGREEGEQTTRQQRWMAEQEQRQERQQQLQHEMLQQLVHLQRESRSEQEQQRVREQDLQGRQEQLVTAEEQERGRVQQEQQEQWDKHEQQHVRELQKRQQRDTNQPRPKVATKREASRSAEGTPAKAKLRLAQDSEDSSESPSVVDWATDGSDSEGAPPSTPSSCRGGRWEVGDMVEAQHTDDRWYEAALKGQAADGTWTVAYSNGVTQGGRLPEQMRQKI
ncbi:Reticulocyte-binding protein 2-like protein a [Diplonema papillatum]|nr:Reticulocyte-binding protein 2-like protein a [Diplonema papillatum]KAJ9446285.1 Reticulocyte-binding protein 2-like protein a [Diplonema papillatum]